MVLSLPIVVIADLICKFRANSETSIFINMLGRLNFQVFSSDVGYWLYYCATLLTTFGEIGVLWAMSYGKLDGYFNDYLAKRGDNKLRSLFVSSDNPSNHRKVSAC